MSNTILFIFFLGEHQAAMQSDASPKIFAPPIAILLGVCLTYILQLHMSNIDGAP